MLTFKQKLHKYFPSDVVIKTKSDGFNYNADVKLFGISFTSKALTENEAIEIACRKACGVVLNGKLGEIFDKKAKMYRFRAFLLENVYCGNASLAHQYTAIAYQIAKVVQVENAKYYNEKTKELPKSKKEIRAIEKAWELNISKSREHAKRLDTSEYQVIRNFCDHHLSEKQMIPMQMAEDFFSEFYQLFFKMTESNETIDKEMIPLIGIEDENGTVEKFGKKYKPVY